MARHSFHIALDSEDSAVKGVLGQLVAPTLVKVDSSDPKMPRFADLRDWCWSTVVQYHDFGISGQAFSVELPRNA